MIQATMPSSGDQRQGLGVVWPQNGEPMTLLSVGDRIEPGTYHVHSRFARAVNFRSGDRLVAVVSEYIGGGPLNIVIEGLKLDGVRVLKVSGQYVVLGSSKLWVDDNRRYQSEIDFGDLDRARFQRNLTLFGRRLVETSHPKSLTVLLDEARICHFRCGFERAVVGHIASGVQRISNGDIIGGIRTIKGCGFGLTPSGDDFIAGLLIGLNFIQRMFRRDVSDLIAAIYNAAKGESFLSNIFLSLARDGLLFEQMKNLLALLLHGDRHGICSGTGDLLAIGESSGADLGTGFFMTVRGSGDAVRGQIGGTLWS